jgi:hypothetical protein
MTILILQQLVAEFAIVPFYYVAVWHMCRQAEDGTLQLLGRQNFNSHETYAMLNAWAATAVLWGPLIPFVQPLALLATAAFWVLRRLEADFYKVPSDSEEEENLWKNFLVFAAGCHCLIVAVFCLDTGTVWGRGLSLFYEAD